MGRSLFLDLAGVVEVAAADQQPSGSHCLTPASSVCRWKETVVAKMFGNLWLHDVDGEGPAGGKRRPRPVFWIVSWIICQLILFWSCLGGLSLCCDPCFISWPAN